MSKMVNCKTCEKEIAKSAATCPNCGARQGMGGFRRALNWVAGIFFLIVFAGVFLSPGDGAASLPACDSSTAQSEVAAAMEGAPMGRVMGLELIKISEAEELSATEKERQCRGTAQLSNANKYPISYKFYVNEEKEMMIEAHVDGL